MKFTFTSRIATAVTLAAFPLLALAQTDTSTNTCNIGSGTIQNLFGCALDIINDYVVPIIFAIAFVVFLLGIFRYFIQGGGSAEKTAEGQKFLLWSIIAFVIMFSVWGIINLFLNTLGFGGAEQPNIPTFTNTTSGSSGNILNEFGLGGTSTGGTGTIGSGNITQPGIFGCATGTTAFSGGCLANGTTYTSNGTTYTAGPNGGITQQSAGGTVTGDGTVAPGGRCSTDTNCQDANGNQYGCFQGTCTVDGDAPADGTVGPGGACTNDKSCEDVGGQSYGCSSGLCTLDGDQNNADGTVAPGGSCTSDANCEDVGGQSYGCSQGFCTADGDQNNSDGTVAPGGSCTSDVNCEDVGGQSYGCSDGFCTADGDPGSTGVNQPQNQVPGNGTLGAGGDCEDNPSACGPGLACQTNGNGDDTCGAEGGNSGGTVSCDVGTVSAGQSCFDCQDGSNADSCGDCDDSAALGC